MHLIADLLQRNSGLTLVIFTSLAGLLAWLGTFLMRQLAQRNGWLAVPRADRWHNSTTAQHGGIGFYPVFALGTLFVLLLYFGPSFQSWILPRNIPSEARLILALLVGSSIMFSFGVLDDFKHFRPASKLLSQLIAASLFIIAGGVFPLTNVFVINLLITYFWFIGIINATNMLDNMDGLSSGIVILAAGTLVILAGAVQIPTSHWVPAVPLGLVLLGTTFGFWLHNRPPARIFMGDSGSLFLGYALAALAVPSSLNGYLGIHTAGNILGPALVLAIPATVLAIPIFDTTLVTLTRMLRAQSAFKGGQDHSSHRLVGLGISEKRTIWLLYALGAFGGLTAILMQRFPGSSIPIFGTFAVILIFSGVYLGHVKIMSIDSEQKSGRWTPMVTNLMFKRHAIEVLLDTVLITISFMFAYLLRFEGTLTGSVQQALLQSLPLVVPCCLLAFALTGIYRGQWRLISVSDIPKYVIGVVVGAALSMALVTFLTRFPEGHSRSVYVIFSLLLLFSLSGTRLSFRLIDVLLRGLRSNSNTPSIRPVLIYGGGKKGKMLHDLVVHQSVNTNRLSNPEVANHNIVGFIDDDPGKVGSQLCGLPIRSPAQWLARKWEEPPHIWISSKHIKDQHAIKLAERWEGRSQVQRMNVLMKVVNGSVAPTPGSATADAKAPGTMIRK